MNTMRRSFVFCVIVALLLFFCSCGVTEKTLLDRGLAVISLMDDMMENDAYVEILVDGSTEDYCDRLQLLSQADYENPTAVYELTVAAEQVLGIDEEADALPPRLASYLSSKALQSVISQWNSVQGVDALVVASLLTANVCFTDASVTTDTLYLYTFDAGYPIAVVFLPGDDGAVMASGCLVMCDMLLGCSAQTLEDTLSSFGVTEIKQILQ